MKEEGEAGAEMWIKASPRERAGVGGGDLFGQGIDLQAPGSDAGRRSAYAVFSSWRTSGILTSLSSEDRQY